MRHKSSVYKIFLFFLLNLFIQVGSGYIYKAYASGLTFYNYSSDKNEIYTGKQVTYTYNSRELALSYPGILINGTALADYEELFVRELGLNAEIVGDAIILSDEKTTLILVSESKEVYVNGVPTKMSVAPVKLGFGDTIKYYVPTRFVAETFGFGYVWVSDISTVRITKTLSLATEEHPFSYNGTLYAVNYLNQRIFTTMPVIYYNGVVMAPAKQVFEAAGCSYVESGDSVHITKNQLTLQTYTTSKIAYVNGKKIITDTIPVRISDPTTGINAIYLSLEFVADMLGFELTYSEAEKCYNLQDTAITGCLELYPDLKNGLWEQTNNKLLTIEQPTEIYFEWVTEPSNRNPEQEELYKVLAYATEQADIVELYGITKENINDFFDNGIVVLELNNVYTNMDAQFFSNYETTPLNYAFLTPLGETIKLHFMIPSEEHWYIIEAEECVRIYFTATDLSLDNSELVETIFPDDQFILPLPQNVDISNISDNDLYWNHSFELMISGNHENFYKNCNSINPYYGVEISNIYYDEALEQTVLQFTTKTVKGYKYSVKDGYLYVTIGKPDEIYSKIIVLDAGHGGTDPGAVKKGINEKDINFKILNTYTKELFDKSDIKVYFTRVSDILIDLYERAAFASEVGADMFISLHMNSNNSSSVTGTEVYYCKDNNAITESGLNSYKLAETLVNNLSTKMNTKNRGVLSANFVVVKYNTVPAVLIELGYMSNASDLAKITNEAYQKKAAETIYQTVVSVFDTYLLR